MKKSSVFGIAAAILAVSALPTNSVHADEGEGWYINGSYYQTKLNHTDNKDRVDTVTCVVNVCTTTSSVTSDYRSNFGDDTHPGIAVGYDFVGPYRTELEYRQHSNDLKGSSVPANDDTRDTKALYFNLWRDFQVGSRLYPYLGAGLGYSKVEQGDVDDDIAVGQLGAGVAWFLTQRLALDIGYRYFIGGPNPELSNSRRKLKTDYDGQTALIGLRYNFFDRHIEPKDSDGDGVMDDGDRCPGTMRGVSVDANGCAVDTDGDGLADYLDKCPNSSRGAKVDEKGCEEIKTIVLEGVNFETNSAVLTSQAQAICESVAAKLQTVPDNRYEVQGHTDDRGDAAYNKTLSQNRAEAFSSCLVSQGVAADRLEARGYGEDQPVASNDSREGRAQNRRVVLQQIN